MTDRKYDLVLYGASGFTGAYVLEEFVKSEFYPRVSLAIAGRSLERLQKTIKKVSGYTGENLDNIDIIIADSSEPESLDRMAKQAKVVMNVVGPFRIYGEAVVKACVQNGTSHVDISGEPTFIEGMHAKYDEEARKNNAYIISACGWDSIPCDMGVNFLKSKFEGCLAYAESFVELHHGYGYSLNDGTYQTAILSVSQSAKDDLGAIRRKIMPIKLEKPRVRPPKNPPVSSTNLAGREIVAIPFLGSDKSVVQRSQYFDATVNKKAAVPVETYLLCQNKFWAYMGILWLMAFNYLVKFDITRKILQKYPYVLSGGIFSKTGPTREQCKHATFTYWVRGTGWDTDVPPSDPNVKPTKQLVVRCDGPDVGYVGTSGCLLSSALTVLFDRDSMPFEGGVFTTASAFQNTKIYDRLASFNITFRTVK